MLQSERILKNNRKETNPNLHPKILPRKTILHLAAKHTPKTHPIRQHPHPQKIPSTRETKTTANPTVHNGPPPPRELVKPEEMDGPLRYRGERCEIYC